MAKTTFKKPVVKAAEEETQELLKTPNEPATIEAYNGADGSGWGVEDIRIPYFSLVQKTGQLSNDFDPGGFVFNKELSVGDGKDPIELTVLRADKYFVEDVPYDPDIRPKRFNTKTEFENEGFSLDYNSEMRVKEAAELVVLVPVEEGRATLINGTDFYVRALWVIQSSAFNTVGRTVATAMLAGHLRDGVHFGKWALTSELRSNKSMSWYVPIIRSMGRHGNDTAEFIEKQCIL
tara:strand:+ start:99 stop:803 length:705 start_codon:yes stop_codon:yes gene_type:complete